MAMTRKDKEAQTYLAYRLREEGYRTYAELLELFEFWYFDWRTYIKSNPGLAKSLMWRVAWMEPNNGRICVNALLEEHMQLLAIRHEILHEYLDHELRLLEHLAEKFPDVAKAEKEQDMPDITLRQILYSNSIFNQAADYDLSKYYSKQDMEDSRNIKLNGQIVGGLILEDDHPEWLNLSLEDIYDKLIDEREKQQEKMKNSLKDNNKNNSSQQADSDSPSGDDEGQGGSDSSPKVVNIIRGTLKNGRFYDQAGNDITPED